MTHQAHYPLLGKSLELRSNSDTVTAAAEDAFGHWRQLEPELVTPRPVLRLDIVVHPGRYRGEPYVFRAHGACFLAASGDNLLCAHMRAGRALGFVTPELVADEANFRYSVLECLGLLLATHSDRLPIHSAAVVRNGRAVLLVGRSQSGKSTLSYACLREGFQLLAEDAIYVSTRRGLRVWGNPWRVYLLPDAGERFPELASLEPRVQASGKLKLAVDVIGGRQLHAERAIVCLLERHSESGSSLERASRASVLEALFGNLEPGLNLYRPRPVVATALMREGAYRLRLGADLAPAVALLRQLTD